MEGFLSMLMRKILIAITLLAIPLIAGAQMQNARREADKMSRRAEGIFYEVQNQSASDSIRYFRNIMDVVDYSLKSDEYDRQPDNKGMVKLRHESENHKYLKALRPLLIDAGLYLTSHRYRQDGINAWKLYLKASECPLLKNDESTDETGIAAFYIAQAELYARNYKAADRYADIALKDDDIAQDAAEIKARCMHDTMVNHDDSVKYLAVLAALYRTDPQNNKYFAWIMQFYSHNDPNFNLENFIDEQLQHFPNSSTPWLLKGETAMHAKRWEEAADAYKHADNIDHTQIPIIYNIGVCLMNWGIELENSKTKANSKAIEKQTDKLFADSRKYLEQVKGLDPHREKVDWVTPLYQVYVIQGENDKADELKPLVKKN